MNRDLYLNTLRDCLTGLAYRDGRTVSKPLRLLARLLGLCISRESNPLARVGGQDWPDRGLTMVGTFRLENIRLCLEDVIARNIPGDYVECGVWRGGASIFARGVLRSLDSRRHVWCCDSFQGLPKGGTHDPHDVHHWSSDYLGVEKVLVADAFKRFHLLDEQVHFHEGWFEESLPVLPCETIAVLRLDGDMYSSTMDILTNLYPRVSEGGFVIVDDFYNHEPCRTAVRDYMKVMPNYYRIDTCGMYWMKGNP